MDENVGCLQRKTSQSGSWKVAGRFRLSCSCRTNVSWGFLLVSLGLPLFYVRVLTSSRYFFSRVVSISGLNLHTTLLEAVQTYLSPLATCIIGNKLMNVGPICLFLQRLTAARLSTDSVRIFPWLMESCHSRYLTVLQVSAA
jgi:hypothetical protein